MLKPSPLFPMLVILLMAAACTPTDLTRPDTVARAFMQHLAAHNYEEASHHVVAEDRDAFLESTVALEKAPGIPDNPQIALEVDGEAGVFRVPNWHPSARFELVLRDGRWWIRR